MLARWCLRLNWEEKPFSSVRKRVAKVNWITYTLNEISEMPTQNTFYPWFLVQSVDRPIGQTSQQLLSSCSRHGLAGWLAAWLVTCKCNKSNYDFFFLNHFVRSVTPPLRAFHLHAQIDAFTSSEMVYSEHACACVIGTFVFFRSQLALIYFCLLTVTRNANIFITEILCTHCISVQLRLFLRRRRVTTAVFRFSHTHTNEGMNSVCLWRRHHQSHSGSISRTQHYNHHLHRCDLVSSVQKRSEWNAPRLTWGDILLHNSMW